MSPAESIHLENHESGSNKYYDVHLKPQGEGWVLHAVSGAIGKTAVAQTKIAEPVDYATAKAAYDKLVKSKKAGGYKPAGGSTTELVSGDGAKEDSGLRPQLLNDLADGELEAFLADPAYGLQEKFDGERRMLEVTNADLARGINRKGEYVPLPQVVAETALSCCPLGRTVLDGELIGEVYYAFDVLMWDGQDLRGEAYLSRHQLLERQMLQSDVESEVLVIVPLLRSDSSKRAGYNVLVKSKAEGVVFKLLMARYTAGRPNSGGTQRKFKFWNTADCVVTAGRVGKRSVGLALLGKGGAFVGVSNVTIPANYAMPKTGDVVQVRYLYAYEGGSLFQPQYEGVRADKDGAECVIGQLHYKQPEADEA